MNSLLVVTLIAAAAVASVVSNKVSEPELDKTVKETELEEFEYDEFGVPLRTVPASRQNLNVGTVGPDDRLISRTTFSAAAASFIIHSPDLTIRGAEYTNITSVQQDSYGLVHIRTSAFKYTFLSANLFFNTVLVYGVVPLKQKEKGRRGAQRAVHKVSTFPACTSFGTTP
ncbi:hypothetical protein PYW08_009243 [Mythimna loreyi]|uniref:Uncharacterized protein n=1 Tax=Mythimna loreyi TaxID=667449 RepID=A0ACC2Q9V9_9NEOP|nr:hypothetical protein PYW08_009243 [Mythimna loreyi]